MKTKYKIMLMIIVPLLAIALSVGMSYAYFTSAVLGNETAQSNAITTGVMALEFTDGDQVILNNAVPGTSVEKTFKVKNTGNLETTYDLYFSEILNELEDKNDLVYTLTSETGCSVLEDTIVPSVVGEESKITTCNIGVDETHEYTLTIKFIDDNTNQDDNRGKRVSTKISVNEYKDYERIAKLIGGWNLYRFTSYDEKNIKNIIVTNEMPENNIETQKVSSEDSYYDIYRYTIDDTLYYASEANMIYLNEDASYVFSYFPNLEILDLSHFNTSLATKMNSMFSSTGNGNTNIIFGDYFDTSNVTNMGYMFEGSSFKSYDFINDLDYSSVTNMYKFLGNIKNTMDFELKNIYFPKLEDIRYMFNGSSFKNIKITNVEAPNVNNTLMLFKQVEAESIVFENSFNEGTSLENLQDIAVSCDNLISFDFGSFNTRGIKNIKTIFSGDSKLININFGSNFDTSETIKVEDIIRSLNSIEEIDLGEKFDTSKMESISLISSCNNLKILHLGNKFHITSNLRINSIASTSTLLETIYIGPDAKVYPNNSTYILGSKPNLVGGAGTQFSSEHNTAEYLRIDDPDNGKPGYFTLDPRYN